MVEGLRLLGLCPRCGGEIEFTDGPPADTGAPGPGDAERPVAPHLVLGIPRR